MNHRIYKPYFIISIIALTVFIHHDLCTEAHSFSLNETLTAFPEPPSEWKIFSKSLTVSPDSTILAGVAQNGEKMAVVKNGVLQETFSKIGRATPVFSPDSSIMVKDEKMVGIDYFHCKGCGLCASVCPHKVQAITMEIEET